MFRILRGLAVPVWAVLACPVSAAQMPFGCKSIAQANRLLTLRAAGGTDDEAGLQRLVRAGECRLWAEGEPTTVEDESEGLACLAPSGSRGLCYWSARPITASAP